MQVIRMLVVPVVLRTWSGVALGLSSHDPGARPWVERRGAEREELATCAVDAKENGPLWRDRLSPRKRN